MPIWRKWSLHLIKNLIGKMMKNSTTDCERDKGVMNSTSIKKGIFFSKIPLKMRNADWISNLIFFSTVYFLKIKIIEL